MRGERTLPEKSTTMPVIFEPFQPHFCPKLAIACHNEGGDTRILARLHSKTNIHLVAPRKAILPTLSPLLWSLEASDFRVNNSQEKRPIGETLWCAWRCRLQGDSLWDPYTTLRGHISRIQHCKSLKLREWLFDVLFLLGIQGKWLTRRFRLFFDELST